MIANQLTDEIGDLWGKAVSVDIVDEFNDIVEMSETLTDVVNRIIELGYGEDRFEIDPETLDKMSEIAVEGDEIEGDEEPEVSVALSAAHAPSGGITIAGKEFTGGEFIPGDIIAKASPEERAKLSPAKSINSIMDDWEGRGISSFMSEKNGVITLSKIAIDKASRGKGLGSAAMKELTEFADKAGKTIALSPSTDFGGSSKSRLAEFYERFGFVKNKGKGRDDSIGEEMIRRPERQEPAAPKVRPGIEAASTKEYGQEFETGKPVTFNYVRNTVSSKGKVKGNDYQQDIEPAGRYLLHQHEPGTAPPGWEEGKLHFKNPLVLRLTTDDDKIYGPGSWKSQLQSAYKKKGKALSQAIAKDGHDGIVTIDKYGTSEIVDLSMFKPAALSGGWQKVGGSSVYVDDGRITKGCPGLKGEMVEDLIDESDESREEREARQQHAEAAGIKGTDVTATEARSLGKTRKVQALRSAKAAAKKYNVSTRDVIKVMPDAHKHLMDQVEVRESARKEARRKTGLNAHKISQLEDSYKDHTNIKNFDVLARSLAFENPQLNWNPDDDNGGNLWELLKEDREEVPAKNSPEVAEMAAQMIASSKRSGLKRKPHPGDDSEFADDWDDWDQGQEDSFDPDQMGDAFEGDDEGGFDPSEFDKPNPRQKIVSHVSKHLKTLRNAAAEIQHFKNVARSNGVNPDEVIDSLGGVPFSVRSVAPAAALLRTAIAEAARRTERNPTAAQKEAGNYRKGRFKMWGREFVIENARGSNRSGIGPDGVPWSTKMPHHYGYIRQTESEADGDHLDVYIGPDVDSDLVFVVDQVRTDGDFDEHKIMIGFNDPDDAEQAYFDAYCDDWDGFGGMTRLTIAEFLDWIEHGNTAGPLVGD